MKEINERKEEVSLPCGERLVRTTNAVLRVVAGEHLLVPIRGGQTLDAESLYVLDDGDAQQALARLVLREVRVRDGKLQLMVGDAEE